MVVSMLPAWGEDAAKTDIHKYIPVFHGTMRTFYQLSTATGDSRFVVRNARLSAGGFVMPRVDYLLQVDFSDRGKIKVVLDQSGSSMATYLSDSLLQGRPLGPTVFAAGSIPEVFDVVEKDPDAIGVLGVSWITSDMDSADLSKEDLAKSVLNDEPVQGATLTQRVKVLKVYRPGQAQAYKPYQKYIFDGSYPLFRQIYMITTASPSNVAGGFYSFVTGPIGQKIIMKTGILPATVRTIQVELPE